MNERVLSTAIIPVAGLGTRDAPFTYGVPKFMIPVYAGNQAIPNINFALEECIDAGIENIVLVVDADGREQLERYIKAMPDDRRERYLRVGKMAALEDEERFRKAHGQLNIEYIVQSTQEYGTAIPTWLALNAAQPALGGVEYVAVTGGDDYVWHVDGTSELALAKASWQQQATAHAIMGAPVPREVAPTKGILTVNDRQQLVTILECPDGSPEQPIPDEPLANISRYIFRIPDIQPILNSYVKGTLPEGQKEYRITDVVNQMIAARQEVAVHTIQGTYLDTGNPEAARFASNYMTRELLKARRHQS